MLAAEIFPISVRATAHGLSAASGKIGALLPAVIYNYVDSRTRFWIVCWFGFAGWIVTLIFIPDTTGLDLREQDRYWQFVREGRSEEYHGIAVHPRHLSWFEKFVLKRHLAYDAELDRKMKVEEMKRAYDDSKAANFREEPNEGGGSGGRGEKGAERKKINKNEKQDHVEEEDEEEDSLLSSSASAFFASKSSLSLLSINPSCGYKSSFF